MDKKVLLMVANVDWIFIYHRLEIAIEAKKQGYRVIILTRDSGKSKEILQEGLEFINLPISRSGTNIMDEIKVLNFMFRLYRNIKPDMIYHVTMKPVIYGTLIARILKIKTINGISGLGYNFTKDKKTRIQKIMIFLMKLAFNKNDNYLVFENEDDFKELSEHTIISDKNNIHISKGVGVNLEKFKPKAKVSNGEKLEIILAARMLWDKGVKEFIEAALLLKDEYLGKVTFRLYGMIDNENKESVPLEFLNKIEIKGYLEWLNHHEDMVLVYNQADIVVLPSYREGKPTVLLEASAMGLPIITTNAIGCKDCVIEGVNGYTVPVKNIPALAKVIKHMIDFPEKRKQMGKEGRKIALKDYNRKDVVNKHLELFNS